MAFDYRKAFSRNIGWVTENEQETLRNKRISIAGMGGVGGIHLLTLARLGIGKFRIADLDSFDMENFNRQVGASICSIGQEKVEVLERMVMDINPEAEIQVFRKGVNKANLSDFFFETDLYVDGLDFFAFEARENVFSYCSKHGIPATTVAPLGIGAALINFMPGRMTFDEYFGFSGQSDDEKALRFLVGLAPAFLHRNYLADASRVNLKARKGPSTIMACQLCAGIAASEALKILLGRGKVLSAPHGIQFDAYKNKTVHTWRPGGFRNPLNLLSVAIARNQLLK